MGLVTAAAAAAVLLAGAGAAKPVTTTYDYIVVGGGTGGNAVALRLAQARYSVALIEAGTYYEKADPVYSYVPAADVVGCGADPSDTNAIDWNYVTAPQVGAGNREVHYARGKCLGGSSARNFMIYQRGTTESYQKWADDVGDNAYTFAKWLPYFQKSINVTAPGPSRAANATAAFDASDYAKGGPLSVSYANYAQPFSSWMEAGLNAIGLAKRKDGFEKGQLMGTAYCASTIEPSNQTRSSSEASFLRNPPTNLHILDNTLAKKIVFNSAKKATGVVVTNPKGLPGSNATSATLKASREIIVSAGAFGSPQLLMVSGVGPAEQLKAHNIPIVHQNDAVGTNMWDHVFWGPSYRVNVKTLSSTSTPSEIIDEYSYNYAPHQQGPLTNPVADFLGWEKVPDALRANFSAGTKAALAQFPADWPELEYISGAGYVGNFSNLLASQPMDGYQYGTILSTLVAPLSRGTVTLKSNDTSDLPIINPNWLAHPADQEVAVAAFKRARQAFASQGMAPVVIGEEYYPGPSVQTDAQILQYYQNNLMTVWHAACTCKMGKVNESTSVIDSQARVIGVTGLRVVDASAFPLLPPGHPQSTVYALAELISARIISSARKFVA